jgi:hypothetical protein
MTSRKRSGRAAYSRCTSGASRSRYSAFGKVSRSHQDFPVPRGPRRKKWPRGAWKNLPSIAINAALLALPAPILLGQVEHVNRRRVARSLHRIVNPAGAGFYIDSGDLVIYLPPQDIFEQSADTPYTDLDLLVLTGGRFLLGEVKADPTLFTATGLERLAVVAEELWPDEVLVLATGECWPAHTQTELEKLRGRLANLSIALRAELLRRW